MDHKPFTYEHFIQAIQSFRDDMLMYYIDDAVGIYCTMKGISVGRRPASSRDYSQEYSDAFEAANYAVYKVARKIGSYNPDEGPFKKYLDSALGNALKDIFKADGYGLMSNEDIENEPDTSASDAEERVRRHKDDAFETMIRFIDTLPEIKRAAVYASAFGQILRPDLEGYGRNYADILAGIYHTTALYIRQLATEGKKAALAEARRQGFSERSMNEVYMGMLQAKVPARDLNDEVLQATDQLNPYQQFMLLRHLSQMANNNVNNNSINTNTNNGMSTEDLVDLLEKIKNLPSPFKDISKLADLEGMTGVSFVIANTNDLDTILDDSIKKIDNQISKYHNDPNCSKIFSQIEIDIYDRRRWAEDQKKKGSLLGLYSRRLLWFDDDKPTIYLFADNINDYALRHGTDVENVFAYVFIHEMMHAYYDAFKSVGFPSREPLEEAFAEFGMLTFIKNNVSRLGAKLLDDACNHVESKIKPGPSEYGFGFDLFNLTKVGDPKMVDQYRDISNWIDWDIIRKWTGKNKYFDDIRYYPGTVNAQKCFDGVKEILAYKWPEPDFIIQPKIRSSHSSSGARVASKPGSLPAIPRVGRTGEWALTASKIDWHFQYPLIQSDNLDQLMVEVLKVMKNEGFESYLSLASDKIVFLGRLFSYYASTAARPYYTLPESLNVKGTVVYPAFKARLSSGPAGQIGNILYALGTLLDGTFTLVHEGPSFVLYGPERCSILFEKATSSSKGTGYTILDKTTSRILSHEKHMNHVPLFIVKDFCSKHPGVTLTDLQKIFNSVPNHSALGMSIIESAGSVGTYISTHPPKPGKDRIPRFFEDEPITLADGDTIMVSNQWADSGKVVNFGAFKKVAEGLGYIIK